MHINDWSVKINMKTAYFCAPFYMPKKNGWEACQVSRKGGREIGPLSTPGQELTQDGQ